MTKPLTATTPFGEDVEILSLTGTEGISELFTFSVSFASAKDDLDFSSIVGEGLTVTIEQLDDEKRYIHGKVVDFIHAGMDESAITYRATLRPWLWLLGLSSNCRIFQSKAAPDIIKAVFDDAGFTDYKVSTNASYSEREYCVQFMETDLNFVSRLMEEEGMFYFFEHESSKHTLVIADADSAFEDCTGHAKAAYMPRTQGRDHYGKISKCHYRESVATGSYQLNDYNFEKPTDALVAKADSDDTSLARYDYPGTYTEKSAGEALAKIRLAACQAETKTMNGLSFAPGFTPGFKFTMEDHPRSALNQAYVLRRVSHSAGMDYYNNSFEAFPSSVTFRPPLITRKPRIHGSQTALVVGKSGEEIWTEKYGRIKVQFHWDTEGQKDENSSCWVRVVQGWAGKKWGAFFLPRMGQEVIVSFLEGDPDRPIVTGAVYNADMEVPYALPTNQTQSTIKSISSKSGEAGNEIRYEDKKDSEEFYIHAQKDMKIEVENDRSTTIIKGNETQEVQEGNRTVTITKGSETLTVSEGDRTVSVAKGKETYGVKSTRDVTVEGNETHTNKANLDYAVDGDYTIKVKGDLTIDVDGSITIKAGSDITLDAGGNLTCKAGSAISSKAGTELKNEAGTSLTNKSGTDLTNQAGTNLTNKASVNLENSAGVALTSKGSATGEINGGGMLTLKGGLVQIN
jgi:type VI secretion system secreted protein VgrG